MMVRVDEHAPTHKPAVVCIVCGGDDSLTLVGDEFVCRGPHTRHKKRPIPFPDRFYGLRKIT